MALAPSLAGRADGDVSDLSDGGMSGAPVAIVELGGNADESDAGVRDGDDGDGVYGKANGEARGEFDADQ